MTININKILGQAKIKHIYTLLDFDTIDFDNRSDDTLDHPLYCQRLWLEDKAEMDKLQHKGMIYCAFNTDNTIQLYTRAADRKDAKIRFSFKYKHKAIPLEFLCDNRLRYIQSDELQTTEG